jgi:hypothetical protein
VSLALAIPLGVASALVYGTSIVVQHDVAHGNDQSHAKGLVDLLHNPRWLMAIGGDFVGFLLQIGALAAGPVVIIQPLVVLMLPVALVAGWLMGGPRPRTGDYLGSAAIILALGVFLVLIGTPGAGVVPGPNHIAVALLAVIITGLVACFAVIGRSAAIRGATYGLVAGAYFGTLGVMVDAASDRASADGWHGLFVSARGYVPLIGILLLGLGGIVLTQVSFQIGALGATLPANLAADPFTAVLIGALLLREHLPLSAGHLLGYALCLAAVIAGAVQLAEPATAAQRGKLADTMD